MQELDSGIEPLLQLSAAAPFRQEQDAEANLPKLRDQMQRRGGLPCDMSRSGGRGSEGRPFGRVTRVLGTARRVAIGAYLANAAAASECERFYWRDRNAEVDFVVRAGKAVTVIEVKSGRGRDAFPGFSGFGGAVPRARKLVIGAGGVL